MGDRCWLQISFPKKELPRITEALNKNWADRFKSSTTLNIAPDDYEDEWWDEKSEDGDWVEAHVYEANYGWYGELHVLAEAGLTFTVSHGSGGEYGPCVYACYKGDLVECSADWNGCPVAAVGPDGVDEKELADCLRYHRLMSKMKEDRNEADTR